MRSELVLEQPELAHALDPDEAGSPEHRAGYVVAAALGEGMGLAQGDRTGAHDLWQRQARLVGRSGGPQMDFMVSYLLSR